MGDERKRTGVQKTGVKVASASSIQIAFTYKTRNCRERLKLKPTPAKSTHLIRRNKHCFLIHAGISNIEICSNLHSGQDCVPLNW